MKPQKFTTEDTEEEQRKNFRFFKGSVYSVVSSSRNLFIFEAFLSVLCG